MDEINQLVLNAGKLQLTVTSLKALDCYEGSDITIIVCGKVYCDNTIINVTDISALFASNKQDLSLFASALSGSFFILVHQKLTDKLYLFNDRFALLPCYYTQVNDNLFISDSLKTLGSLSKNSPSIDPQAIYNYIYFHCIPAPTTIFKNIFKLEAGKAIVWLKGARSSKKTWDKPTFAQEHSATINSQQDCLQVIKKAVDKYTDKHTGAFLSGGLDSSTVAGMLAENTSAAKTFSIGFNVADYDETSFALITAKHFSTEHKVKYLQAEDVADKFVQIAQFFDEPFGNSSALATYFCGKLAQENGISRLLAGDGGDEIFAGNDRYVKQKKFELFHQLPESLKLFLHRVLGPVKVTTASIINKGRSYINQASLPLPERLETYNFINKLGVDNIFTSSFLSQVDPEQPIQQQRSRFNQCHSDNIVDKMLYLDWKFTLSDNDIVKVSKMCELAGIEVSFPLLDNSVVDFSCTIPAAVKLPKHKLRHYFKESCKGFLADQTLTKSKHGFGLPFGAWLKENERLNKIVVENLERFKKRDIIQSTLIDNVLLAHKNEHSGYYGELIWVLVVLELWLQQWDEQC